MGGDEYTLGRWVTCIHSKKEKGGKPVTCLPSLAVTTLAIQWDAWIGKVMRACRYHKTGPLFEGQGKPLISETSIPSGQKWRGRVGWHAALCGKQY